MGNTKAYAHAVFKRMTMISVTAEVSAMTTTGDGMIYAAYAR